ncbi:kinase-like protein [Colletotrichum zoysiae]|uniref:Kinase-like protein n=1 Tax=Colletotrichum zoysiae TaxID=1216348 RepID=A0AAD9HHJ8_9PEZI|nr:kinase-like protein [Colletotrichum zoysiae]
MSTTQLPRPVSDSMFAATNSTGQHNVEPPRTQRLFTNTMIPRTRSHNNELRDEMAVDFDTMDKFSSTGDELFLDENPYRHSQEHPASHLDIPRTPDRARNTPFPWKDVNFPGGPYICNGISLSINAERREPSDSDAVVSVYDMGLSISPDAPQDSQKYGLIQNEANGPVFGEAYPKLRFSLSADHTDIEDIVREKMERHLCWSEMDQKEYLPRSSFEEIFTIPTVESLVEAIYTRATDDELSRKIDQIIGKNGKSRRMIIATLVFMKHTSHIEYFIQEDIFDHHMPLRHTRDSMREFRTRAGTDEDKFINTTLFAEWERVHVDLFYIYQKMIVVPVFKMDDGTIRSYVLDRDVRLPWEKFEHKARGGHGIVHRLQIHPSHHKFQGSNKPEHAQCYAVKEIHAADQEFYRKELRALVKSCARVQKEKHLIKLLLTFQHGDRLYLVFEWADGNLQEFWAKKKVESRAASASWMLQQCRGIANAVKRIHGLATWQVKERSAASGTEEGDILVKDWGRHGDIKPSNILWFSTYGEDHDHLVVADLGLTRYHSRLTKSRVSRVDGFTGTYRAPEIDLDDLMSSKYDIWSLGCVFLEFCVWYLLGAEAIAVFERDRRLNRPKEAGETGEYDNSYFITDMSTGRKKAVLHPAIDTWIRKLEALESYTPFARQILKLVTTHMLVIDPKGRYSTDRICRELFNIVPLLPGLAGEQTHSSGTIDTSTHVQRQSLVRFAEGNSSSPDGITTIKPRHGRMLSVSESDEQSLSDEASNIQSTVATSVLSSEQDYKSMP